MLGHNMVKTKGNSMKKLSEIWYEAVKTGRKTMNDVPRLLQPRIKAMLEGREMTFYEFVEHAKGN